MPFEMPEGMMQVTVGEVTKDSPADKAGLQAGDVISAANGTAVATPDALVKLVQAAKPGDKVNLSIVRDGQDDEIVVTLGENPDKKGAGYMGISLGATMKFENLMPGRQGSNGEGFEIFPGFQLPFDFGGLPFEIPQQTPEQNDTLS
jgi:membrane-associated protease RseP (regulator of RpoE activity)